MGRILWRLAGAEKGRGQSVKKDTEEERPIDRVIKKKIVQCSLFEERQNRHRKSEQNNERHR